MHVDVLVTGAHGLIVSALLPRLRADGHRVVRLVRGEPEGSDDVLTGTLLLDGAMPVDEIKARLDLPPLPAEGAYHTLGGLLLALLKRLPRTGDRIVFGGWRFEVAEMEGRRVSRVSATREPRDDGGRRARYGDAPTLARRLAREFMRGG